MRLSVLSVGYPLAPAGLDTAGGAEQVLALLDRALVRAGHRSVVIAGEGSRTEGELIETRVPGRPLTAEVRTGAQRQHARVILQALARRSFDLIHLHSVDFHAYMPPAGIPALVTLHLPPSWYPRGVLHPSRPDTWLHCVSAAQARQCPSSPALLPPIENGVPVEQLGASIRKRDFAVVLGRICPEKGFHLAIDAAREAGVPLLLAGEVYGYEEHEEYFRRELLPRIDGKIVRYLGPVGFARKRRLLAAARCVLAPSLAPETSSLAAMEALASGTPVIAFRAGALPDVVEHGRTGFIVENAGEMAEAIRRVDLIDPETCRRTARQRFSADRMTDEYLDRYQWLARSGARTSTGAAN